MGPLADNVVSSSAAKVVVEGAKEEAEAAVVVEKVEEAGEAEVVDQCLPEGLEAHPVQQLMGREQAKSARSSLACFPGAMSAVGRVIKCTAQGAFYESKASISIGYMSHTPPNRSYGSGYPGTSGFQLGGRGFPFYFWPMAWGGAAGLGTGAYLHNREVCSVLLHVICPCR